MFCSRPTVSATICGKCTDPWHTGTLGQSYQCCSDQSLGVGSFWGATTHTTNQSSTRDTSHTLRTSRCWWRESRSPWPWPRPRLSPGWGLSSGTRCRYLGVNTLISGLMSTGPACPVNIQQLSTITQVSPVLDKYLASSPIANVNPRHC